MPRSKKPASKKFTQHQVTLDPETVRYLKKLVATEPDVDGLSAAIRHVVRRFRELTK